MSQFTPSGLARGDSFDSSFVMVSTVPGVSNAPAMVAQAILPTSAVMGGTQLPLKGSFNALQASEIDSVMNDPPIDSYNTMAGNPITKKYSSRKRKGNSDGTDNLNARRKQAEARVTALESILNAVESVPPTMEAPEVNLATRALYSSARDVWFFTRP
ncbi:hypothetical protein BDV93DRAFT_564203, partial [Ceratobasidium sp. AG-I]